MNTERMMTNLKAELPGYGTLWFDPQAMTNVLSLAVLPNSILFDIYKNWIHFKFIYATVLIFLAVNWLITYTFWKEINPEKDLNSLSHPKKTFPKY